MRSNFDLSTRNREPGGRGYSQYSWGFPDKLYAEEMEQKEAAAWVEFVIVGQRRKHPVFSE